MPDGGDCQDVVKIEFSDGDLNLLRRRALEAAEDLALSLREWAVGSCRSRRKEASAFQQKV